MRNFGVEKNPGKQNNLEKKFKTKSRFLDSKYNQKKHIPDTFHGINIGDIFHLNSRQNPEYMVEHPSQKVKKKF